MVRIADEDSVTTLRMPRDQDLTDQDPTDQDPTDLDEAPTPALSMEMLAQRAGSFSNIDLTIRDADDVATAQMGAQRKLPHEPLNPNRRARAESPSIHPPSDASAARLIDTSSLVSSFLERGMQRQDAGNHDGAIEDYGRVLEREPRNTLALYNRGVSLMAKHRYSDASRDFARALEQAPHLPEAAYNNALALLAIGNPLAATRFAGLARRGFVDRGDDAMLAKVDRVLEQASKEASSSG